MKIDLRKDKGVLATSRFQARAKTDESIDLSEEERIAEVMRRRMRGNSDGEPEDSTDSSENVGEKPASKSKRNPIREFVLLVILLAVTAYYLNDKGLLTPYTDIVMSYWTQIMDADDVDLTGLDQSLIGESVLSDDIFNSLMPVSDDLAALADSIEDTPLAAIIYAADSTGSGAKQVKYLEVPEKPLELGDQDIQIINNRSLLLMLIEIIGVYPEELGTTNLFLKRDAISITAPRGGEWVGAVKKTLDAFVFGSFKENYSKGNAQVSSKFEIIMNAEQDFVAQNLDALRLLDVLAHPFNDYLEQIVIDLSRKTDDNPAKFSFSGTAQEIRYILSSWAESRCNILIRSVDIKFSSKEIFVTLDVEFFNYRS